MSEIIIKKEDAVSIVHSFFELINSHYGVSIHDIGGGDGISHKNANEICRLYNKYSKQYYHNGKVIENVKIK